MVKISDFFPSLHMWYSVKTTSFKTFFPEIHYLVIVFKVAQLAENECWQILGVGKVFCL